MKINKCKIYILGLVLGSCCFLLYYTQIKAQEATTTPIGIVATTTTILTTTTPQIISNSFPMEIIFGRAMWYGKAFHEKKMANGKKFDMFDSTLVAHRTLPLGTKIKVVNIKTGISIDAIVSDRGPYSKNKKTKKYLAEIDLSYAGAKILGIDRAGIADVKIKVY